MTDAQQPSDTNQDERQLVHPVMVSFLYGQYANLFKFSLWWTTLAPLTFALFDSDATAIGVGRIVYNVALCVLSPIGGIVCERVHPRKVLLGAASVRFAIWCVLVPLLWVLFDASWVTTSQTAIWVLFNLFLMLDGASVALSTVLDIDLCGVDIVAGRFGYEVTDHHRNQFNGRQELFFAACFVIFTPGMAFLGLAIHEGFKKMNSSVPSTAMEAGTLGGIFVVTFGVATALQFYFFRQLPDDPEVASAKKSLPEVESALSLDERRSQNENAINGTPSSPQEDEAPPSGWEAAKSVPGDLLEAVRLILRHPPILFRLVFLGLEIAFEDAAIVVIASQMGITLPWLGDNDSVNGNIWTAVGVASGKLGGAIASFLMIKYFQPPAEPRKFFPVFVLILLSCAVIFVFPATVDAYEVGAIDANGARALYLVGFFVYFFLSTLPKLGLMCLFQSMVSQVENGPRVFGFIAIVATTFDALVVMGLSVLFVQQESIKDALWITAYIYLTHGVLELIVGPIFVLRPLQAAAEGAAPELPGEETRLTTSNPEPIEEEEKPAGTYSQRSASILVAGNKASDEYNTAGRSPRGGASPRGAAGGASSHRATFLSVSHTAAVGSVTRKNGALPAPEASSPTGAMAIGSATNERDDGADDQASPLRASVPSSGWMGYTRQGSRLGMTPRNR